MYAEIHTSILDSSINSEPLHVRWVFVACCLMADFNGNFQSTVDAISRRANVPLDETKEALEMLQRPDLNSTTPDEDGRRLIRVASNTWHVVNRVKYRNMRKAEDEREATRLRVQRFREKHRSGEPCNTTCNGDVTPCNESVTTTRTRTITRIDLAASSAQAPAHTCVREEVFEGGEQNKPQGIEFNTTAGRFIGITPENIEAWQKAFPGVPIEADILQAAAYYRAHPERMGKGKAEGRLLAWFKRSQKGPAEIPAQKATSYVIPATPDRFKPPHDAAEHELLPPSIEWPSVLNTVKGRVSSQVYNKWLANLPYLGDYITHEGSGEVRHAVLQVADEYSRNHIHYNLGPSLADAISDVMGCSYRLAFKVVNAGV
jgi:hypothetical protein